MTDLTREELEKFRDDFNQHVINDKIMFDKMHRILRRLEKQTIHWPRLMKNAGAVVILLELLNTCISLWDHWKH